MGQDTLGRVFLIFYKGNKFCDFLFAFMHTKLILKMDILYNNLLSLGRHHYSEVRQTQVKYADSPERVLTTHVCQTAETGRMV